VQNFVCSGKIHKR